MEHGPMGPRQVEMINFLTVASADVAIWKPVDWSHIVCQLEEAPREAASLNDDWSRVKVCSRCA
jgi:hypothetical protein